MSNKLGDPPISFSDGCLSGLVIVAADLVGGVLLLDTGALCLYIVCVALNGQGDPVAVRASE
jgi:hypothetical protein